jgi:hypothetical protein
MSRKVEHGRRALEPFTTHTHATLRHLVCRNGKYLVGAQTGTCVIEP